MEERTAEQNKNTLHAEEIAKVVQEPIVEEVIPVVDIKPKKVRKPKNEIPIEEDTSSFNTEECVSDEDIETTLDE